MLKILGKLVIEIGILVMCELVVGVEAPRAVKKKARRAPSGAKAGG